MFRYSDVFLSLGSNVGNRHGNLERAISLLGLYPGVAVESISGFYRSDPLYNPRQPEFLNCAARVSTDLTPRQLLMICLEVERNMGRWKSTEKNAPRLIDIDIIFFGDKTIQTEKLRIPHERYFERKFVLVPLCDIAPDFMCPDTGKTVKEMFQVCPDGSRVERSTTVDTV